MSQVFLQFPTDSFDLDPEVHVQSLYDGDVLTSHRLVLGLYNTIVWGRFGKKRGRLVAKMRRRFVLGTFRLA